MLVSHNFRFILSTRGKCTVFYFYTRTILYYTLGLGNEQHGTVPVHAVITYYYAGRYPFSQYEPYYRRGAVHGTITDK